MSERMPVLFIGCGSPLNGVADNSYTQALKKVAATFPRPKAIVCASARYITEDGIGVTAAEKPRVLHDYYDYPDEIEHLNYPAPGSPEVAQRVHELTGAALDHEWGLDCACWLALLHMYPDADIPVVEISFDPDLSFVDDLERGEDLMPLRDEGVLIMCSGNIVHNLSTVNWNEGAQPYDWAASFDQAMRDAMTRHDLKQLLLYKKLPGADHAAAKPDFLRPLFVAIGAAGQQPTAQFFHTGIELSSISLTCARFD